LSDGSIAFTSSISHLAAQDYVFLDEGFEASGAYTTVIISTMPCQNDQIFNYSSSPMLDPNYSRHKNDLIKARTHE
jgi:hypothetical protein